MNTNESAGAHGWAQRAANNEDALCEKKYSLAFVAEKLTELLTNGGHLQLMSGN
jgi:hypothetical protein